MWREHCAGYQLSFNVVWPAGSAPLDQTLTSEIINWQSLGILITHSTDTFNNVISDCTGAKPFEICAWGYGWSYVRATTRRASRCSCRRRLQRGHLRQPPDVVTHPSVDLRTSTLSAYANFAAQQLPVLYQPQANSLVEVARTSRVP